jgi:hypothetical protein
MNAANETVTAMSQGFAAGRQTAAAGAFVVAALISSFSGSQTSFHNLLYGTLRGAQKSPPNEIAKNLEQKSSLHDAQFRRSTRQPVADQRRSEIYRCSRLAGDGRLEAISKADA